MRLVQRVAWVTGAAQGLGEAIAHRLAQEGCIGLTLMDLQQEKLQAVAQQIERESPSCRVLALYGDVTDEAHVAEVVRQTVQTFGRLDILVANAGVIHSAEVTEMTLAQWRWQLEVNLTGYFLCAREAAKVMKPKAAASSCRLTPSRG